MQLSQLRFSSAVCACTGLMLCSWVSAAAGQNQSTNLIVTVRHAPVINGGKIVGSLQQLTGGDTTLNAATITGDWLVPGTPAVRTNGLVNFQGVIAGTGSSQPAGYRITLNKGVSLRYVRTRTNPTALPTVSAPPKSTGTRNVTLTAPGQSPGDFSTARNLTVSGTAGLVPIPPGTYGTLTANGTNGFVLGITGAIQPVKYSLQSLLLNGNPRIQLAGPVTLVLSSGLTVNGTLGMTNQPTWLQLSVASGGLILNCNATIAGQVLAPNGCVTINGNSLLLGSLACDQLTLNIGGVVQGAASSAPAVNRAPVAAANTPGVITWPDNQVVLNGVVMDDGLPVGNVLRQTWSQVSGPGSATFSTPEKTSALTGIAITNQLSTTATFTAPGLYELRLTADDGQTTNTVDVIVRVNRAPTVSPQSLNLLEDTPTVVPLSAADEDGDTLIYKILTQPLHGSIAGVPPNLIYQPATNYNGPDSFSFEVNDGQVDSPIAVISLVVQPVNDAPQLFVPGDQTITAGSSLVFDTNRLISIADGDAGAGQLQLSLSVSNGSVMWSGTNGLIWQVGTNGSRTQIVQGSLVDLNVALPGLSYLASSNFPSVDTLILHMDDLGNTGTGGNLSDLKSVLITITASTNLPSRLIRATRASKGTDFWLTFLFNPAQTEFYIFQQALIAADTDTQVEVVSPRLENLSARQTNYYHFAAGTITRLDFPPDLGWYGDVFADKITNNSIHISASAPVSVYGFSREGFSADGYLALPTAMLGTNYLVMAYGNGDSQFAVLATEDNTRVTIVPTAAAGSHPAGQPWEMILHCGETYRVEGINGSVDYTGTSITADKPIAVLGGATSAYVPADVPYADHLVEEMTPVDQWGEHFVTMPLKPRLQGDTFRFLACTNDTRISVNGKVVAMLDQGQFHEQLIEGPADILSTQPILVVQYANGTTFDHVMGDPFMMLVPPIEQFVDDYLVEALSLAGSRHYWEEPGWSYFEDFDPDNPGVEYTSYMNLIVSGNDAAAVELDGQPVSADQFQPIGDSGYFGAQLAVSNGVHHVSTKMPAGVSVYGWSTEESYAFSGGLSSDRADPDLQIALAQKTTFAAVGHVKAISALVTNGRGLPVADVEVPFSISGVNPIVGRASSSRLGEIQFFYVGTHAGVDVIGATLGNRTSSVTNTWIAIANNLPPVVSVAGTKPLQLGLTLLLSGTVTDDDQPAGSALNVHWQLLDGPGNVAFENADQTVTRVTCTEPGIYRFEFVADDSQFSSHTVTEVTANLPPSIQFPWVDIPPVAAAGTPIELAADSTDPDGTISRVEFYANGVLVGTTTTNYDFWNGYNIAWTPWTNGLFQLNAVVYDDLGTSNMSDTVSVHVDDLPVLAIDGVTNGAVVIVPTNIMLHATATDPDGAVVSLSLYLNGELFGTSSNGDLVVPWFPRLAGDYTFHAVATDDLGLSSILGDITVTVTGVFPRITFTSPVPAGFAYDTPTGKPITLQADALIAAPYQITNVSISVLGEVIGSFSQPPYSIEWTPHQINYHQIIAEADADSGAIARTVLWVNSIPDASISFALPVDNQSVYVGQPVPLQLLVQDPWGILQSFDFSVNGEFLAGTNSMTFWTPPAPGNYSLYAQSGPLLFRAFDSVTASYAIAPESVGISSPQDGTTVYTAARTPIVVTFDDPIAAFDHAEFFANSNCIGQSTNSALVWRPSQTNNYALSARIFDRFGQSYNTTNEVTVRAIAAPPPQVTIATPAAGSRMQVGMEAVIVAALTDPGQLITNLDFYADGSKLGDNSASFLAWAPDQVGNHELQVIAAGSDGSRISSAPVDVTVIAMNPPLLSLLSPTNGQRFTARMALLFRAQAMDSDGLITNLNITLDSTVLSETNGSVLETLAIPPATGWHDVFAQATDNDGLKTSSQPVQFFVERPENSSLPIPEHLTAEALKATEIQLSWPVIVTNDLTQSVLIERWDVTGLLWVEIGRVPAGSTEYIDSNLNPETNYRFRIAILGAGDDRSPYSEEANATTRVATPDYALIDLAGSINSDQYAVTSNLRFLMANTADQLSPGRVNTLSGTASVPAAMQDLTPLPIGKLEPLWMAENGSCLLKAGPNNYLLWRSDGPPVAINNPNFKFLAHRLTNHGLVVGTVEDPFTSDEAGNRVPHSWGAWWDIDANAPVPLTAFDYHWPRNAGPLPDAGLTYSLLGPSGSHEFLTAVTSYPTLQDVWDLNGLGEAVGSVSVKESFLQERIGFDSNGQMNWFNPTERGLDATFGTNSTTETDYQALLNTAAQFNNSGVDWRWLGPLAQGNDIAVAQLVNDAGMIAGYGGLFTGDPVLDSLRPSHAFRAQNPGEFDGSTPLLTDLGVLPGGAHSMPRAMNQSGELVGFSDFDVMNTGGLYYSPVNSHATFWGPTNTAPEWLTNFPPGSAAPFGYGDAFAINDQSQIAGASLTADSRPVAVLWQRNHNTNGTPFWEITDLNEHTAGPGWELFNAVGINNAGWILAQAVDPAGERHAVLLVQSEMGVDANRDGQITFDQSDQTSSQQPYRFWLNDDMDIATTSLAWSESDPEVYPPGRPDSGDRIINSPRDCEDLTRLWLDLRGAFKLLQDPSGSLYAGLKWKNVENSSPSIRLFRSADSSGGLGHIKNARIAAAQAAGNPASEVDGLNFCLLDVTAGESSQAPIDAIDEVRPTDRPADFIFKKSAFSGLSQTQSNLFLLFEGVSEGKGELELVFLKRNSDGSWKTIGDGPSVWFDLKNIRRMYVRAHATPVPKDFPLPWQPRAAKSPPDFPYVEGDVPFGGYGALTIPDANLGFGPGDSLESPSDYPLDPPLDEQNKCIVFVHGISLTVAEQQGYAQSFFKRLWWEGYRGRFAAFSWSTTLNEIDAWLGNGENFSVYNSGEYRSWKQGTCLRKYVNSLRSELGADATISLVGHSLGNACVGEALRQGLKVSRYVGMEAAVPLSCYYPQTEDPAHPLPTDPDLVATDQADPTPQYANELGYQGYLAAIGNSLAAQPISYYNADDFWLATGTASLRVGALDVHWMMNERKYKPDNRVGFGKYDYESQFGQTRRPGFRSGSFYQRWVEDPAESMAFVSRPRTRPLGAGEPAPGFVGINLKQEYLFDRERSCHSGQFQRNIQLMYGDTEGKQWIDERGRPRPLFLQLIRSLNVIP